MPSEIILYREAVEAIKLAILQSQYHAAKGVNAEQLQLYYCVGAYISAHTRNGQWGSGALAVISEQLQRELPGLRGFSERNLKYMRTFFVEWASAFESDGQVSASSAVTTAETSTDSLVAIRQLQLPNASSFPTEAFLSIGFTHHCQILTSAKTLEGRLFYIHKCAEEHLSVEALKHSLKIDDFHHQGQASNNFTRVLSTPQQALRAINVFKDEYLLDFINVEEFGARDSDDIDERVLEQAIVNNIKNFIMTFGHGFSFIGNQYHLDAFGQDQYIDLLFFNRDLNCLVAIKLKSGPFKTSYLGQMSGYLSVLDGRESEGPSIGLILCKDMNKAFVDYVIQDFSKPLGVAAYKTSRDMSEELIDALPGIEELKTLLEGDV